jgi:uncharacterized protein
MIVVADSSPLIALPRIRRLDLLREMFGTLLLPDAVWNELTGEGKERAGALSILEAEWVVRKSVDDLQELAGFWLSPQLRGLIIGP